MAIPVERLITTYLKMKAEKDRLDAELKDLELNMRKIKAALNDEMRETGLESLKTKEGLVYRTIKTTYGTADWASMHRFILEHGVPELLEKRLHQGNVKDYIANHPDELPPGLNANMEYSVTVKRNTNVG